MLRVNDDLIAFHRPEKSESPGGKVRMGMQMVGQNHDGIDGKGLAIPRMPKCRAQQADLIYEHRGSPVSKRYREKECPARDDVSPISHHRRTLPRIALRSIRATDFLCSPDGAQRNPELSPHSRATTARRLISPLR